MPLRDSCKSSSSYWRAPPSNAIQYTHQSPGTYTGCRIVVSMSHFIALISSIYSCTTGPAGCCTARRRYMRDLWMRLPELHVLSIARDPSISHPAISTSSSSCSHSTTACISGLSSSFWRWPTSPLPHSLYSLLSFRPFRSPSPLPRHFHSIPYQVYPHTFTLSFFLCLFFTIFSLAYASTPEVQLQNPGGAP